MKTVLMKTMILSFTFVMTSQAMLRPCMKALMQRNAQQLEFLKQISQATQKVSKIENVFFLTHQLDDSIVSIRLQELNQCGIPVYVLLSHALAYGPSSPAILDELYGSGIAMKVFHQKYNNKIIELTSKDIWKNYKYRVRSLRCDQKNNMSLLMVNGNDRIDNTLVLQSGDCVSDTACPCISVTCGHPQFNCIHKKISDIFHDNNESTYFKP
ncbi:MAG TPA: hypothetical protein VLG50_07030 [Candidatus Saccharimonadales bacterium]|nr:hypothetical protein [Candidatus Saccharimonadales bacterium]